MLDEWGVGRRSLAVVPRWAGGPPLAESPELIAALRAEQSRGSELMLHGYEHRFRGVYARVRDRLRDRFMTGGCAEFSAIEEFEAERLLRAGFGSCVNCSETG